MAYKKGDIIIDEHFARFGAKSYAIDKITSIEVKEVAHRETAGCLGISAIAFLIFILGFGVIAEGPELGRAILGWCILILGVLGFVYAFKIYAKRTVTYSLVLLTSAGEVQATSSPNLTAIQELRRGLEDQIAKS